MSILTWLSSKLGTTTPAPAPQRTFAAAQLGRLTAGWNTLSQSPDAELRYSLITLRSRCRELAANNVYVRRYLQLLQTNVVGPAGITLQSKVTTPRGRMDDDANSKIEAAWQQWGKKGTCDVTGRMSWKECQDLALECWARDGEVLIVKHKGSGLNKFGYALQFLEADHLDDTYNVKLDNGNEVRMGVELDQWGRPAAYWIRVRHPGDYGYGMGTDPVVRQRIPAGQIIHIYKVDRPNQHRGYPRIAASMSRINMMSAAEEAELIGWRASAAKMGFITSPDGGDNYVGDGKDASGNVISEIEPGVIEMLPSGYDFKTFDAGYPNANISDFSKHMLRGIAGDMGVDYPTLANDLEAVNYSSGRLGSIDSRDNYRTIQRFLIDNLCQPVFEEWLEMALLSGAINLPAEKRPQFTAPKWVPRGWVWVDPLKEQSANETALANNLTSLTRLAAETGDDIEDIFRERAREKKLAAEIGINLVDPLPAGIKQTPNGGQQNGDQTANP